MELRQVRKMSVPLYLTQPVKLWDPEPRGMKRCRSEMAIVNAVVSWGSWLRVPNILVCILFI